MRIPTNRLTNVNKATNDNIFTIKPFGVIIVILKILNVGTYRKLATLFYKRLQLVILEKLPMKTRKFQLPMTRFC